ncbi:hypothetical protein CI109_105217 [Kwoniella shandongensis]|uniref:Uncharacterized protein n=1 Tax=Kwoniella shandongensis TaxID=1734106 RepID=A0A5M6C3K2_9TREE|nr:uncharacterized protein CI109_002059 [Kwoniella shandongensis]KAA5529634.1 hypothetical protein CI109_002059 [Kwoniella shandongensis]
MSSLSSPTAAKPFPHSHISIPPQFHSMTAGAGAGLISSIVTCPLDVVKTSLQAQAHARDSKGYEGVGLIVRRIWKTSGPTGFYRGLGPTLLGYLPTWGIYFTVYDLVKDRLGGWVATGAVPIGSTSVVHIIAAMTAGATGTIMTNPLWVVKTRFMAQAGLAASAHKYRNTLEAIADIYRTEGFRAFYKGLLPSLLGVSHVAVQFPLYEKAKSWADKDSEDHSSLSPGTILACSAFSKMFASLATYPHEVLRTRLQIRKTSITSPASASASAVYVAPSFAPTSSYASPRPVPAGVIHPLYSPLITGSDPPRPNTTSLASSIRLIENQSRVDRTAPSLRSSWKRIFHAPREGGIIDTFISIKRQDGWRGFYRGLSINLVRTVPNSAATMLTYELIMRRLSLSSSTSS